MAKSGELAAEGKGYASAAKKKEDAGDREGAKHLYLKASKAFLKSSKITTDTRERDMRKRLAQTFYDRGMSMVPRKRVAVGEDDDDEPSPEVFPMEKPNITFENVGGMEEVKEEIRKAIVYPFEHPEIYQKYGKKAGEGILFYGPPGCGKTFIAKAAAGECKASFLTLKVSDILGKYVGESEKNIKAAFKAAEQYAPSILFFDELDAIGGRRSDATEHSKRLVNELLTHLDGISGPQDGLLTLAATNEPWAIDPALRRPGRFAKLILVPNPDESAREQIFSIQMKKRRDVTSKDVDFKLLAQRTDGYSSADIAQICSEASDIPLEEALEGKPTRDIRMADFEDVLERRSSSLTPWFAMAKEQIEKSKEEEIFKGLMKLIARYT